MHLLHTIFEWLEIIIDVSAAIVMVLAFADAMFSYVQIAIRDERVKRIRHLQIVRCDLGVKLVFALELLIISDLLVTIFSRSLDDMIIVGALVLIRTVIAYFLNKEIEEVSAEISS
ncbi:MAG: DUF1622 domain-containing protein [Xanthomonadales bacterium]|nr:DUF1622 domain-containing protein [Xanthomonadales bacterium]